MTNGLPLPSAHPPTPREPVRCLLCGQPLRDRVSIERGFGATCFRKMQKRCPHIDINQLKAILARSRAREE